MKFNKLSILLSGICLLFIACKDQKKMPDQPTTPINTSSERMTKAPKGTKYEHQGFWEYLPEGYKTKKDWPLLVFYHGLGENGSGDTTALDLLLEHGPPMHIINNEWPLHKGQSDFIVLSVQNSRKQCHEADDMKAFLEWAMDYYSIDKSRVYLTGLSCGAIGTWSYLEKYGHEEVAAATVLVCGDGRYAMASKGCSLGRLPIWAFHGDADGVVPVEGTTEPIAALRACEKPKAVEVKETIYPGVNHSSWRQTYDLSAGHDIYTWLLSHSKS